MNQNEVQLALFNATVGEHGRLAEHTFKNHIDYTRNSLWVALTILAAILLIFRDVSQTYELTKTGNVILCSAVVSSAMSSLISIFPLVFTEKRRHLFFDVAEIDCGKSAEELLKWTISEYIKISYIHVGIANYLGKMRRFSWFLNGSTIIFLVIFYFGLFFPNLLSVYSIKN